MIIYKTIKYFLLYSTIILGISIVRLQAAYFEPTLDKYYTINVVQVPDPKINKVLFTQLNNIAKAEGLEPLGHKHVTILAMRIHESLFDYAMASLQEYLKKRYPLLVSTEIQDLRKIYNKELKLPFMKFIQFNKYVVAQFELTNPFDIIRDYIKRYLIREVLSQLKSSKEIREDGLGTWTVFRDDRGKIMVELRRDFLPHVSFARTLKVVDLSKYADVKLPDYFVTNNFEILTREIQDLNLLGQLNQSGKFSGSIV